MVSGLKVLGVRQEEGTRDILHKAPVGAWRRKGRKGAISRIRIKDDNSANTKAQGR